MAEFFTKVALFKGNTEIEQLDVIFKLCGSPTEKIWPKMKELPWTSMINFKDYPRNLTAEFVKLGLTPQAIDLIDQLLTLDPLKRLNCAQALLHPYFTVEQPPPSDKEKLPLIEGDWHEFEGKQRKRNPASNRNGDATNLESNQSFPNLQSGLLFPPKYDAEVIWPGSQRMVVQINRKVAGIIIGHQGNNRKQLESRCNVKIVIFDSGDPNSSTLVQNLLLYGFNDSDFKKALDEIEKYNEADLLCPIPGEAVIKRM